jgi:hypothetical protein
VPRDVVIQQRLYSNVQEALVAQDCPGQQKCMDQYLLSYEQDQASKQNFEAGCSGSTPSRDNLFRSLELGFKSCVQTVFGDADAGLPCVQDSECESHYSPHVRFSCPLPNARACGCSCATNHCDLITFNCTGTDAVYAQLFVSCFTSTLDPFVQQYVVVVDSWRDYLLLTPQSENRFIANNLSLSSTTNFTAGILSVLTQKDCVPSVGMRVFDRSHWVFNQEQCLYWCLETPVCLFDVCPLPIGCEWVGFPPPFCAREPIWVQ